MVIEMLTTLIPSTVLISVVLLLLVYYSVKYYLRNTGYNYNYPPGPRGIPLFGFSPNLGNESHEFFDKFSKEYGDIFTIKIAGRRYVVLNGYECLKEAYITNGNCFSNRPEDYNVLASISESKAMAFINGEEWRLQRKVFTSALKLIGSNDANIDNIICETSNRMVEEIKKFDSRPVDLYGIFANSTINVVSSLICGEALVTTDTETADVILKDSREAFGLAPGAYGFLSGIFVKIITYIFTTKQQKIAEIRQRQFNIMKTFIQAHQNTFDQNDCRDYIDLCFKEKVKIEDNGPGRQWFSVENMAANMFLFFMAGTDTTSSAMYSAAFMLVKYPEVQKKCREELDVIIGQDTLISFRDRDRLPYIEAVINEVIRYSAIGAIPQPRCTTNPITIRGFHIPARTDIIANLWSGTRDKKYWTNPMVFDPDNFYGKDIPRDLASLSFSAGKRICPGERLARMEIFLFITSLLQKFVLVLPPGENVDEEIVPKFNRVLAPFRVIAIPR